MSVAGWRLACTPKSDGVWVAIRLTPKGRCDEIGGTADTVGGGVEIRASVTAVPENGKANKALIKLLSKKWRVPKTGITIISGETDRHKVLHLNGDPDDLIRRIAQTFTN